MRTILFTVSSIVVIAFLVSFTRYGKDDKPDYRKIYSRPPGQWPRPLIAEGVDWKELGLLPGSPLKIDSDSIRALVELGKVLFFDSRISGSGKISCASCHQPALAWTDGRARSLGHEGAVNKRNSPTIQNVWFYKKLFWDGRSRDLEDQAFAPINSESEMHADMRELPLRLKKIKGYPLLFKLAYGDPDINADRIAGAIAAFERTIISRPSRFDEFLKGRRNALSSIELRGLHIFRTKAGCMNCHNGPLFTDNQFHQTIFTDDDKGQFNVTHLEGDMGKFKTPSLRDLLYTGPYTHSGSINNLEEIIALYEGVVEAGSKPTIPPSINLGGTDVADLLAFLKAISSPPLPVQPPVLPD